MLVLTQVKTSAYDSCFQYLVSISADSGSRPVAQCMCCDHALSCSAFSPQPDVCHLLYLCTCLPARKAPPSSLTWALSWDSVLAVCTMTTPLHLFAVSIASCADHITECNSAGAQFTVCRVGICDA